jgi:lipoprotein-anchoring transpeptidase ErfK/SrfK
MLFPRRDLACFGWDMRKRAAVILVGLLGSVLPAQSQDTIIMGAMQDEESDPILSSRRFKERVSKPLPGYHLRIETVDFDRGLAPGSIVVQTATRQLFLVLPDGKAKRYPVGVGKQGFTWKGSNKISRKAQWPDWRPPKVMIAREAKKGRLLPEFMKGGIKNPLGARALYLGDTEFRIHGTSQPWSIGKAVSSGCIRMLNEHVIDLYNNVSVGAVVVVE